MIASRGEGRVQLPQEVEKKKISRDMGQLRTQLPPSGTQNRVAFMECSNDILKEKARRQLNPGRKINGHCTEHLGKLTCQRVGVT